MKTNFLFVFIFLMSINLNYGQEFVLKGKIIDQKSSQPITFSVIEIRKARKGTYSDSTGNFSITHNNVNDTLEFSSIGYKSKRYKINEFIALSNKNIKLEPYVTNLQEVVVVPGNYKTIKLGTTNKKPWRYSVSNIFGGQFGIFIKNDLKQTGYVKAVSFYIAKKGYPNTPFRIRIYSNDHLNNCPGIDLLNENVIVSNSNGEGWFTVNISKYNIPFGKDGIYVMMEWIYSGDQYYYTIDKQTKAADGKVSTKIHQLYGLSLGNACKQQDGFWQKGLGERWKKNDDLYKGQHVNVMINADISIQTK